MPTPTGLLDRAVTAAGERAGRDLKQWRTATDLTHLTAARVKGSLASTGAAGGTLLTDVPILKAGTFHGGAVVLDAADLAAMVDRFTTLAPDVFVPPVRIDHSFDVLSVIGHIASLRVESRADASAGGRSTAYLLADLQILNDDAMALIKSGLLRNRSSEIGPYEANTGDVHSLVMWGVAFVDIPAVEGLGAVPLGKVLGRPKTITELTEGGLVADDQSSDQTEQATDQATQEQPAVPDSAEASDVAATGEASTDQDAQPSAAEQEQPETGVAAVSDQDAGDGEPTAEEEGEGGEEHATQDAADATQAGGSDASPGNQGPGNLSVYDSEGNLLSYIKGDVHAATAKTLAERGVFTTPAAALRALGLNDMAADLEKRDRADLDRQIDTYGKRGVLGAAAHAPARALLGHTDPSVRALARELLDNAVAPVTLGANAGRRTSTGTTDATGPRGDDAPTAADFAAADNLDELSDLWDRTDRKDRQDPRGVLSKAFSARRAELANR